MIQSQLFGPLFADVSGPNYDRFHRQFTPGLQEYIEAVTFYHYLRFHGRLVTPTELRDHYGLADRVRMDDYVLGVADFTGELMRFAIQQVSRGYWTTAECACATLRTVYEGVFE